MKPIYDMSLPEYEEACETERQLQVLRVVNSCSSRTEAAKQLGISKRNVEMMLRRIRMKANKRIPPTGTNVPEGYMLSGTSTLVGKDGTQKLQWVKTRVDWEQHQQMLQEAAAAFSASLPKYQPKTPPKDITETDIIPWFNIGDAHLGMLAHSMEVGENFDLKIAERELTVAMMSLMMQAGKHERCVIQDMGDFTHYENMAGVTEHSGHALDYDTRFQKMVRVYIRTMRAIVEFALDNFTYVDVIINQGNHSRTNDIWMANFLRNHYENEDRLTVLDNDSVFIGYRMGNTFVMSHHSDKCKQQKLIDVMATDFREDFGQAKYKYVDVGHVHHKSIAKEYGDVIVESFNQLAPMDKYAFEGGWRSRSFLTCVLRSKTYGEKGRILITAEEVKDLLLNVPKGSHSKPIRKAYRV